MPSREQDGTRGELDDLWKVVNALREGAPRAEESGILDELDKIRKDVRALRRALDDLDLPRDEVAHLLERIAALEARSLAPSERPQETAAVEAAPAPVGLTDEELAKLPSDVRLGLNDLIKLAHKNQFSEFFVKWGAPPQAYLKGRLTSIGRADLSPADSLRIVLPALPLELRRRVFSERWVRHQARLQNSLFQVDVALQGDGVCATFRRLEMKPPELAKLGLPESVPQLLENTSAGLILLVGAPRSGKSTTLAAAIGMLNSERKVRIGILEHPVIYRHGDGKAWIAQREVGRDIASFEQGLKLFCVDAPDVLAVDGLEVLDSQGIFLALHCAASRLVLLTLAADTEALALDILVGVHSADRQPLVRMLLLRCLRGMIVHHLADQGDRGRLPELTVIRPDPSELLSLVAPAAAAAAPAPPPVAAIGPALPPAPREPEPTVDEGGALLDFL